MNLLRSVPTMCRRFPSTIGVDKSALSNNGNLSQLLIENHQDQSFDFSENKVSQKSGNTPNSLIKE